MDPVADLIRLVAGQITDPETGAMSEIEAAVLGGLGEPMSSDPVLSEEALASTRENAQHWVIGITTDPYARVEPLMAPSVVGIARAATRRGAARNVWAAYSAGRAMVWQHWMRLSFAAGPDPEVLARSLEIVWASLSRWIDETVAQLAISIDRERDELTRATHAQKFQTVTLVLEGAPMAGARATEQLGYPVHGRHLGVVLWTDPGEPDQPALSRAAEELRRRARAGHLLTVAASSFSLWVWLGGVTEVGPADLTEAFASAGQIRGAIGMAADDVEGFRRSHYEAVEAQRLMMRSGVGQVATFAEIALVALAGRDEQAAREFVARTLGPLEDADPELRETVRLYIRHQFSAARTAEVLYTHRNTVVNRIRRAETLLPEPLGVRGLEVGTALELNRWFAG